MKRRDFLERSTPLIFPAKANTSERMVNIHPSGLFSQANQFRRSPDRAACSVPVTKMDNHTEDGKLNRLVTSTGFSF